MRMSIFRRYEMSCAHQLHGLRDGHKCATMHGHNYGIEVEVELLSGATLDNGMVVDAEAIDSMVGPIVRKLDHTTLNRDYEYTSDPYYTMGQQPTAENIAAALLDRFALINNGTSSGRIRLRAVTVTENGRLAARAAVD